MSEEQNPHSLFGQEVLEAIKNRKLKMRSRWYFIIRNLLAIMAIVIILLIAVFFVSFIIFVLRQTGAWFVPVFGFAGWYSLFMGLPWVLILLSCIFVVTLAILAKRYPFGYQWPLAYSLLSIFFLIASITFIFIRTSFYHAFFDSATPRALPFINSYYPEIGGFIPSDIHRGEIAQILPNGFVIRDVILSRTSTILVASNTHFPFEGDYRRGDIVVVFGIRSETGTIYAWGVQDLTIHQGVK